MFGGRAAEKLVFQDASTGAQNDLERATELVRQMVCRYGMSEALGPLTYGKTQSLRFLTGAGGMGEERNYSEQTAQAVDGEVRAIVDRSYARAVELLSRRRHALDRMAQRLLEVETLDGDEVRALAASLPAPRSVEAGGVAAPA
jgi:cell division protease FtsH